MEQFGGYNGGILSRGILSRGILSGRILYQGGFCPGGFVRGILSGGFCPGDFVLEPWLMYKADEFNQYYQIIKMIFLTRVGEISLFAKSTKLYIKSLDRNQNTCFRDAISVKNFTGLNWTQVKTLLITS